MLNPEQMKSWLRKTKCVRIRDTGRIWLPNECHPSKRATHHRSYVTVRARRAPRNKFHAASETKRNVPPVRSTWPSPGQG